MLVRNNSTLLTAHAPSSSIIIIMRNDLLVVIVAIKPLFLYRLLPYILSNLYVRSTPYVPRVSSSLQLALHKRSPTCVARYIGTSLVVLGGFLQLADVSATGGEMRGSACFGFSSCHFFLVFLDFSGCTPCCGDRTGGGA